MPQEILKFLESFIAYLPAAGRLLFEDDTAKSLKNLSLNIFAELSVTVIY